MIEETSNSVAKICPDPPKNQNGAALNINQSNNSDAGINDILEFLNSIATRVTPYSLPSHSYNFFSPSPTSTSSTSVESSHDSNWLLIKEITAGNPVFKERELIGLFVQTYKTESKLDERLLRSKCLIFDGALADGNEKIPQLNQLAFLSSSQAIIERLEHAYNKYPLEQPLPPVQTFVYVASMALTLLLEGNVRMVDMFAPEGSYYGIFSAQEISSTEQFENILNKFEAVVERYVQHQCQAAIDRYQVFADKPKKYYFSADNLKILLEEIYCSNTTSKEEDKRPFETFIAMCQLVF